MKLSSEHRTDPVFVAVKQGAENGDIGLIRAQLDLISAGWNDAEIKAALIELFGERP